MSVANGLLPTILICAFIGIIFPALYLHTSLYVDESLFLVMGEKINQGFVLYKDVGDNKTPGVFLMASFLFNFFEKSYVMPRILVYVFNSLSAFMVFLLGKKIKDTHIGIHSSLLFLMGMYLPQYKGYTFITEPFAVFFSVLAIFLLLKEETIYRLGAGLSIGIGYLFNQTIIILLVVIGIFYIIKFGKKGSFIKNLFTMCCGVITPILITCLYFIQLNAFREFIECTVLSIVGSPYSSNIQNHCLSLGIIDGVNSCLFFPTNGLMNRVISFLSNPILMFSTVMVIFIFHEIAVKKKADNKILLLVVWFIFSLIFGFRGLKSYHHMIFVLPPAAILSSMFIFDRNTIDRLKETLNPRKLFCLSFCIITTSCVSLAAIADENIEPINYQKNISKEIEKEIGENVVVYTFPFNNSIIFFSNLSVMNGWLGTPYRDDLAHKVIEDIRMQNITIIIVNDKIAQNVSSSYRIVYEFILSNYKPIKKIGPYIVFLKEMVEK